MPLNKTERFLQTAEKYAKEQKGENKGEKKKQPAKTDNFLKAIKKYANQQKDAIQGEVKQLKSERLKEAEEKAKRDSKSLIENKINETRSRLTAELATQSREGQRRLFIERKKMVEDIFQRSFDKLVEFTKTDEYKVRLKTSAEHIKEFFADNDCILFVNERDLYISDQIKALYGSNAKVEADKTIKIGGMRGFCEALNIILDETLDRKLSDQREWFVENAELSIL